jgi:hypothetical protein
MAEGAQDPSFDLQFGLLQTVVWATSFLLTQPTPHAGLGDRSRRNDGKEQKIQ